MLPPHSSPALRTPRRLHRHPAIAHRERVAVGAIVPMSRAPNILRHRGVHGGFFGICHGFVEGRVAEHCFRCSYLLCKAGCLGGVGGADYAGEVEVVARTVNQGGCIGVGEGGGAVAFQSGKPGVVEETFDLKGRLLSGSGVLDQGLAVFAGKCEVEATGLWGSRTAVPGGNEIEKDGVVAAEEEHCC